jgi:hypothetical protein
MSWITVRCHIARSSWINTETTSSLPVLAAGSLSSCVTVHTTQWRSWRLPAHIHTCNRVHHKTILRRKKLHHKKPVFLYLHFLGVVFNDTHFDGSWMKYSKEHWQIDTDKEKGKYSERMLFQCHSVYHTPSAKRPQISARHPQEEDKK